jgi:membrane-associated phospholipid phosphatase
VGLLFANRRLGYLAAAGALLMAATRLYVGAHWPIDVVAGLLVGGLVAWVFTFALRGPATRLVARLGETALRPLVAAA